MDSNNSNVSDATPPAANTAPGQKPPKTGKGNLLMWVGAGLLIVVALVVFLLIRSFTDKSGGDQSGAVALSSLTDVAFQAPESLPGYTLSNDSNETQARYIKENCRLTIGTGTAEEIAGKDPKDIVEVLIDKQRDHGIKITKPLAEGAPLKMKSSEGKTTYSLPTYTFSADFPEGSTILHHSSAILKNSKRAVVARSCPSEQELSGLDQLATQFIVVPKE